VYSAGAMNSTVDELISGRLVGSPYERVIGSKRNSSGTWAREINFKRLAGIQSDSSRNSITFIHRIAQVTSPFRVVIHKMDKRVDIAAAVLTSDNR
jgi:hypothetical protein